MLQIGIICTLYFTFILKIVSVAPFPNILYTEKINSNTSSIFKNPNISANSSPILISGVEANSSVLENPHNLPIPSNTSSISQNDELISPELLSSNGPEAILSSEYEGNISYTFRGPNPFLNKQEDDNPLTEEDLQIRENWGGDCKLEFWNYCSKIKTWGKPGGYYLPDKRMNGKLVWVNNGFNCNGPEEKFYCLFNGWTAMRCHLLCMAQCNKDYLFKYDKLVKHEGQCGSPIG